MKNNDNKQNTPLIFDRELQKYATHSLFICIKTMFEKLLSNKETGEEENRNENV